MKKKLILIIIQTILFSCKTLSQNNIKMEKIDIKTFKNQELQLNKTYTDKVKDTIIEYGLRDDYFIKNTIVERSSYFTKKTYYRNNLQLKTKANYFYSIPVGISEKYDEKGNLIEKINWDELNKRTFSIEDLIVKMKKEFDIDLEQSKKIGVGIDASHYIIIVNGVTQRIIKINAQTGEVISDETVEYEK